MYTVPALIKAKTEIRDYILDNHPDISAERFIVGTNIRNYEIWPIVTVDAEYSKVKAKPRREKMMGGGDGICLQHQSYHQLLYLAYQMNIQIQKIHLNNRTLLLNSISASLKNTLENRAKLTKEQGKLWLMT